MDTLTAPVLQRNGQTARLEWVDIYKGLAILLMVLGHTTGRFNPLIYQFHMVAFFVVSGYTASMGKRGFAATVASKLRSLLFPYLTVFALFLAGLWAVDKAGWIDRILPPEYPYIGVLPVLKEFFLFGRNYIWFMGAGWFVLALFGAFIVSKGLHMLCPGKGAYLLLSLAGLLAGYGFAESGVLQSVLIFPLGTVLIAQFYVSAGVVLRETGAAERLLAAGKSQVLAVLGCTAVVYYYTSLNLVVDFAAGSFNLWLWDIVMGLNGSLLLAAVSMLVCKIPFAAMRRSIVYLGRNTPGILHFHFLAFKAAYAVLYAARIVPPDYFQTFTPTAEIGAVYWPLIVPVTVLASTGLWRALCFIKPLGILLGEREGNVRFPAAKLHAGWRRVTQKLTPWGKTVWRRVRPCLTSINVVTFAICTAALAPLYNLGPIVNDELQYRFARMGGLWNLAQYLFTGYLVDQHRPMVLMASVNVLFAYPTKSVVANGVCRVLLLAAVIMLFGTLLKLLTGNRYFASFVSVCVALFLPVTFEHTAPTAFWGNMVIPAFYLFLSLILYMRYLEKGGKKRLIFSAVLFSFMLLSYEFFITYTPLFVLLAFLYKEKSARRRCGMAHRFSCWRRHILWYTQLCRWRARQTPMRGHRWALFRCGAAGISFGTSPSRPCPGIISSTPSISTLRKCIRINLLCWIACAFLFCVSWPFMP